MLLVTRRARIPRSRQRLNDLQASKCIRSLRSIEAQELKTPLEALTRCIT